MLRPTFFVTILAFSHPCWSFASDIETCKRIASQRYNVPISTINTIIQKEKSGIGPMGIPYDWIPILKNQGIKNLDDPCQNIIAGTWIISYMQQVHKINIRPKPLPQKAYAWQGIIQYYARQAGIPPKLINAVILHESGFNPKAKSKAGAIGLMQLMPSTAKQLKVNPYDPIDNIRGGVAYLRDLIHQFDGNIPLALAAYNAGPHKVKKYGGIPPYKETQNYVKKIMSWYMYS